MNAATPNTTDRETAFQAAVDNVHFEQMRVASQQQASWNFKSGTTRYERWDYVSDLEEQIILMTHSYEAVDNTQN